MIKWTQIRKGTINRVGYNKEVKSLYIDFIGSDTDTAFLNVPEALFTYFVEASFPERFFKLFVEDYFEVAQLKFENNVISTFPSAV